MRIPTILAATLAFTLAGCGGGEPTETAETLDESAEQESAAAQADAEDALVPGTQYHATAQIACGVGGTGPTASCEAGVIRQWGEDGTTLVEVTKPDGMKRAIFVRGTEPYGADSAEADGSAGWDFVTSREGDRVTITYGPESYVLVDAFTEGG